MDSEGAKKRLAANKVKLLRMFAKNPTLKDSSKVLAPTDEAALLEQVQVKQKEQRISDRVKVGSHELGQMSLMQKYQITPEIDEYKQLAFKRTSVSSFRKANAYKRNKAASSLPPDKEREASTGSSLQLKKPYCYSTLKNEIVGAVVANAAEVALHPSHSSHREINLNDKFKLELSKTQRGERKFLPPSIFQKEFEYPTAPASKLKTKAGMKTSISVSQGKEKEGKEKEGKDDKDGSMQTILSAIEPSQPAVQSYFASANDFNYKLQQDKYEEHLSTYRAFNSYVQFCNKVYWGPSQSNIGPHQGTANEAATPANVPGSATLPNGTAGTSGLNPGQSQTSQFIQNLIQQQVKNQNQKSRYQLTAYDILFNPLRKDHPFEDWSPKEISRFQACFLIYGKAFGDFRAHLPRKSYSEIQEFYRAWKHTPFYREWKKQNKQQKPKRNEETITDQLFL